MVLTANRLKGVLDPTKVISFSHVSQLH